MKLTPRKLNTYTMFKLPSAYICGVRTKSISDQNCVVTVKHKWINQNPFKSMFWAVQGMAAEFSTGALVIAKIQESGQKISMLVTTNKAVFTKKATGKITFTCSDGDKIDQAIAQTIKTSQGQTVRMHSQGVNEDGVVVSTFDFEWSIKLKTK